MDLKTCGDMSGKKLAAILIIILALIILIGLVYFMFLAPAPEEPPAVNPPAAANKLPVPEVVTDVTPPPARREAVTEDDLKRLASSFVERYGSYSNQSGYANTRELEIFMSQSMKAWANNYVEQARSQNKPTDIYYGLTTKSVVVITKQFDEYAGRAEFNVQTQRKESTAVGANFRTFQQNALVAMIKEGGAWKVDGVKWEE